MKKIIIVIFLLLFFNCSEKENENSKYVIFFDCIDDNMIEKNKDLVEVKSDFDYYIFKVMDSLCNDKALKFITTSKINFDTIIENKHIKFNFDTTKNYVAMLIISKNKTRVYYDVMTDDVIIKEIKSY
jgi:hypothetical protein